MICESCGNEMVKGKLYGDRYALKWQPEEKKLIGGIWAGAGGIKLKSNTTFGRPRNEAFVCEECMKMVIDLDKEAQK